MSRCPAVPRVAVGQLGWYSGRDGDAGAVCDQLQHRGVTVSRLAGVIQLTNLLWEPDYMSRVDVSGCSHKFL